MIHVITEQSWPTPNGNIAGQPLPPRPRLIDAKSSREEAELGAISLSEKFHYHGYNAEGEYWGDEKRTATRSAAF
jgi:hypothetical protein